MRGLIAIAIVVAAASHARADEPRVMRIATAAPEGSGWARDFAAWARAIELRTNGAVKVKMYFSGKAGSELEVKDRIDKGQLDGSISGGMMCARVMPSMNVLRVTGVFQNRAETQYVVNQLRPRLAKEANARGYALLGAAAVGASTVFSRTPVTNMKELRALKLWRWDLDEVAITLNRTMGLDVVPLNLEQAGRAYDNGKVDGFYAIPAGALAFQWYAQTKYVIDLPSDYLIGCILVKSSSFDQLTDREREVFVSETAKVELRINDIAERQDRELITGGVFGRQGNKLVRVSAKFRAEFFEAARQAREKLDTKLVPRELINEVLGMLADYRGEHH